jgi:hypothetical protein
MRLSTILLLFLTATLTAQPKAEERLVNVYLYAADYAKEHKTVYLAKSNEGYHKIGLSKANIYGPFKTKVSEDGRLWLCQKQSPPPGAETKVEYFYPPIAEVKIPSSMKEPLLVLVPAEGKMRYKALVLERSVTDFPMGSYKLVNFSSRKVRGMIGKTLTQVSAWKMTTVDPSDNQDDRLKVQFQYQEGDRWHTFGSTTWRNRTDKRTLLCAYVSPDTGRMKIRGIPVKEPVKVPSKN